MKLTDEQRMLRDVARDFARARLAPFAAEWDREERFPAEAVAELGKLGFMGMLVPETYGGAGADHIGYALVMEEIAAGEGAVATILSVQNSVGCMPVLQYGSEEQKERFLVPMAKGEMLACFCLTEPQAGSDAAAIKTRARRHGNRWVLNGTKQFISSGKHAQLAIVFAVTDPEHGRRGISAFLVPTDSPGFRVARVEHKLGQRASDTAQLVFEEVAHRGHQGRITCGSITEKIKRDEVLLFPQLARNFFDNFWPHPGQNAVDDARDPPASRRRPFLQSSQRQRRQHEPQRNLHDLVHPNHPPINIVCKTPSKPEPQDSRKLGRAE